MPYEWSLNVTLEIVKAFGPPLVAGLVGYIAWRQWQTAKDKLALDLFDRRFATFNAVLAASRAWSSEIAKTELERVTSVFQYQQDQRKDAPEPAQSAFWRESEPVRFIFGDDVWRALQELAVALQKEERAHNSVIKIPSMEGYDDAWASYSQAMKVTTVARVNYRRAASRYMLLNHIAITRPAKLFRWPWQKADLTA